MILARLRVNDQRAILLDEKKIAECENIVVQGVDKDIVGCGLTKDDAIYDFARSLAVEYIIDQENPNHFTNIPNPPAKYLSLFNDNYQLPIEIHTINFKKVTK